MGLLRSRPQRLRIYWVLSLSSIQTTTVYSTQHTYQCNKTLSRAGEVAQKLRAQATFAEDLGSVPRSYMVAHNCLQSDVIFWLPQTPGIHVVCIHI